MNEWEHIRLQYAQKPIQLGLERVTQVWSELGGKRPSWVIAVAGTNGKGSCCYMLDSILRSAGYRVGLYTSPHLLHFGERICIDGTAASDKVLDATFRRTAASQGAELLTQFELDTLVAISIMDDSNVDVAILEVGLGGRLDAVNAFDADCAIITSVAIDHTDYLGETRAAIGHEKAGIFRTDRPAICADADAPLSVANHATEIGARFLQIGRDFGFYAESEQWRFWSGNRRFDALPYPALRGAYQLNNAAAVLEALEQLKQRLPVTRNEIRRGLLEVSLPGRFQVLPGKPQVILDVAHNPHAAAALAGNLAAMPPDGRTIAVFAMLRDKDIASVVRALSAAVDLWLVAGIDQPRGASAGELLAVLHGQGLADRTLSFPDVVSAYRYACDMADDDDRIAAFGSFYTVADVLREIRF